jgi:hypothetical protein
MLGGQAVDDGGRRPAVDGFGFDFLGRDFSPRGASDGAKCRQSSVVFEFWEAGFGGHLQPGVRSRCRSGRYDSAPIVRAARKLDPWCRTLLFCTAGVVEMPVNRGLQWNHGVQNWLSLRSNLAVHRWEW